MPTSQALPTLSLRQPKDKLFKQLSKQAQSLVGGKTDHCGTPCSAALLQLLTSFCRVCSWAVAHLRDAQIGTRVVEVGPHCPKQDPGPDAGELSAAGKAELVEVQ